MWIAWSGLVLLVVGIGCLWFDTSGDTFGNAFWLLGFFAAGIVCYRLRATGLFAGRWAGRWALVAALIAALAVGVVVWLRRR